MKLSNSVVSVIVIAAVLVFAYALGLLIRQVRTGGHAAQSPTGGRQAPAAAISYGPGAARTQDTPQERARLKDEKAEAIEKASSLTSEQKEKFRSQVRKQVGGRRSGKGLPGGSPLEQPPQKTKQQGQSQAVSTQEDVNAPASHGESTSTKPGDKAGSGSGPGGSG